MSFPKIMGILNITPDSFSDGGIFFSQDKALEQAEYIIKNGADIIDIGGESTRPGAGEISAEEELMRVLPIIKKIHLEHPEIEISIDTTKYEVAKEAIDNGASIINDVSGLNFDERIAGLAAQSGATLIIMHMLGTPRNMQKDPKYNHVVNDIYNFLNEKIRYAQSLGVKEIIADAGIGFGKTLEHNLELLRNYQKFHELGVPIMLGISRKSFIGKITGIEDPSQRDLSTALIHSMLLTKQIQYLRVHNIKMINLLKTLYMSIFE